MNIQCIKCNRPTGQEQIRIKDGVLWEVIECYHKDCRYKAFLYRIKNLQYEDKDEKTNTKDSV